jgi:hypothetical protein
MAHLPYLPFEIWWIILRINVCNRAATILQSAWRGFRLRRVLNRFKCLRFLQAFREWNPNAQIYLTRYSSL